ncbi:MAG: radical SAM protein [Nanohaloarchaea archaeon]|nr:radical SAM protein [Candidatus Nanohaloarchaea archaeon]
MDTHSNELNKDIINLIHKIEIIKYKIINPKLKLNHIIHNLTENDGQLEIDRIVSSIFDFTPQNKEFIKNKWDRFISKNENPYLSLYIHIPFCIKRCSFCEYYSTLLEDKKELDRYLTYLEDEIKYFAPIFVKNKFKNIYIGGGTPTILNDEQLEKLFKIIYKYFNIERDGQHTLEISPYVINKKQIDIADKYVNRISVGIQSLDKDVLNKNNRPYVTYDKLKELFLYIKEKNFKSFDVDFILGLDGDTTETFIKGFENLLKLGPYSIALYKLHNGFDTPDLINKKYPKQEGNINISKDYHFSEYSMNSILNNIIPLLNKYNYLGSNSTQYKTP